MAERKVDLLIGSGDVTKTVSVVTDDASPAPWGVGAPLTVVGTDLSRIDGAAKGSGAARYTADVNRPRLAFARAICSPHAHAKVTSMWLDAAKAMPGVLAAVSLNRKKVTYAGAAVAAVCAETERQLDDAVAVVKIAYEVLPHAVDSTTAQAEGAARVVEDRPNGGDKGGGRRGGAAGDAEKALAEAAVKVSGTYRTSIQTHSALEPHGSVAEFAADGSLTVWCSTQGTASVRNDAAQVAKLPQSKVRVITEYMGGGFGAKFGLDACDRIAIEMAAATGRPVRCMNDRREEHRTGGNRPDSVQALTLGGTKDGTLTVIAGTSYGTSGNGQGGADAANTALYDIPNRKVEQFGVSTHTAIGRAFRAPGHPQGVFALEGMVDEYAFAIGMDPLDVRRLNDKHPVRRLEWPVGAKRIGWAENRRKVPGSDKGPVKRGLGCAGGVWGNFGGGNWRIDVTVAKDGSVVVSSGVQDIGTGTKTVLAALVAEELGLKPADVTIRIGDTAFPDGPGSGGSVTATAIGPAARDAGMKARLAVADAVAKEWGVEASAITFAGGTLSAPGGKHATFANACSVLGAEGAAVSGVRPKDFGASFSNQNGGVQFADVSVDVETGVIHVNRVVAVHDCGRVVAPLLARSQVNGGVIQGISYALFEERRLDAASGDMVNPTLDTYRICGMADCPEIEVVFLPGSNGKNNVGMMGIGEPATVPTAAAVANAVFNAIGVRVRELPMTPARVLAALAAAKGGAK